ncbi:MAG: cellulase family glycosylhydrolase, partial [Oscillospiraceae bacterium]|nr:cellulase family glycosylhydrolase [Oscillospiraceae bacterium]
MYQTVKGFLHTEGTRFVNEDGQEILLRGMGVGNWLNPEGFLFGGAEFSGGFDGFARSSAFDRGRTMDQYVTELAGKTYQKKFWDAWVDNYFGRADIAAMKRQGFNSVRLPLNARFLLDEEPGIRFNEEQFALLDRYLDWCEAEGLYVILDLHAACAGQSAVSCDDGVDNQPHLFLDEESADRTAILWREMARRWKDRWIIAGYDLLNEPISLPLFDSLIPELK